MGKKHFWAKVLRGREVGTIRRIALKEFGKTYGTTLLPV